MNYRDKRGDQLENHCKMSADLFVHPLFSEGS